MPVRLLIDEHITPDVVDLLRKDGIDAVSMQEWHGGLFLPQSDDRILLAAAGEARTLVTYDVHSIPVTLRHFAEAGLDHGGVILISGKTIAQDDIAGITSALRRLSEAYRSIPLRNHVLFLSAAQDGVP